MFKIVFQLMILIYIILIVYHIINLQKFNINGFIIDIQKENVEEIKENILRLNPILSYDSCSFDVNDSQLNYLQDIDNYKKNKSSYVFKNEELFEKVIQQSKLFDTNILYESHFHFPIKKTLTIIKGETNIPLKKCIHNHNIIGVLEGETVIYLFNPKHKEEIINKENSQIKKWGHKKILQKGQLIIIPPYWSFIQEIDNGVIQYHIDIDTYFTFIPNFLKEYYFGYVDK
tara:strand:- start:216 stop:905 length:690 start_codon:yes stop_codon:yes gene_type:complete